MSEPTCAVTGDIAGHPSACGDCDPCSAAGLVSAPVRGLLAETMQWMDSYGNAAAEADTLRARVAELEAALGIKGPAKRGRKPQPTPTDSRGNPAPFSSDDLEARIDKICGCAGKYDCECVSVFGQARSELWYEHNTARAALKE